MTKAFSFLVSLNLSRKGQPGNPQLRNLRRNLTPAYGENLRARESNNPLCCQPAGGAGKYGRVSGQQIVYAGTGKYVVTVVRGHGQ